MNMPSRPQPTSLNFFSTYRCNSRCLNCSIWRNAAPFGPDAELTSSAVRSIFDDPLAQGITDVGFAGGEPTLTGFMERALAEIPEDRRVTVTTNALAPSRLLRVLDRPRAAGYCVQVSMDGLEATNDRVRGVPGGFRKSVELLETLRNRGVTRVLSFTINRLNAGELEAVADLAQSLGAVFTTRLAHTGGAYANDEQREQFEFRSEELEALDEALGRIIARELLAEHDPAHLVFLKNIVPYARGQVQDPACFAMDTGMVVDCYGQVFPNCPMMMHPVGSLKEQSLSAVWKSEAAERVRRSIDALRCGGCWNDCQIPLNLSLAPQRLLRDYAALRCAHLPKRDWTRMDWEGPGRELALLGFHGLEGEPGNRYRWTRDRFSLLLPSGTQALLLQASPPPDTNEGLPLEVVLLVDGAQAGAVSLSAASFGEHRIALRSPTPAATVAEVVLNRSYCPRDAGHGNDARVLGLALHAIGFERCNG